MDANLAREIATYIGVGGIILAVIMFLVLRSGGKKKVTAPVEEEQTQTAPVRESYWDDDVTTSPPIPEPFRAKHSKKTSIPPPEKAGLDKLIKDGAPTATPKLFDQYTLPKPTSKGKSFFDDDDLDVNF